MFGIDIKSTDPFEQVVSRVVDALKTEDFNVLTEIDVQSMIQQQMNIEHKRYLILGVCNLGLAHRALEVHPNIGLLLPFNIVIREDDSETILISFMDPLAVLGLIESPAMLQIAQEAHERLVRVNTLLVAAY